MQRSSMTDILDHRDIEILKSMKSDSRKPMGTVGENQGISRHSQPGWQGWRKKG